MLELFKWMASHPDVILEIEHVEDGGIEGFLQITMRHRSWNVCSKEAIIFDLLNAAYAPDEVLIIILDNHYRALIKERIKTIDDRARELAGKAENYENR